MLRLALALSVLLVHSLAWSAARIAVLRPDPSDTLLSESVTRLQAELRSAGFEIVLAAASAPDDVRAGLEQPTTGERPAATLALSRVKGLASIDVWVNDRVSGKTLVRRIDAVASSDLLPSALAIRAVDLLRASLLETLPDQPPAASVLRAASERGLLRRSSVGLALGALHSFSGVGPSAVPRLHFSHGVRRWLSLRAEVVGPAFGPAITASVGTAEVRQELATLGALWTSTGRNFVPYLGLSAGAYHLRASGRAAPPHTGKSGDVWAFVLGGGVGLALRVGTSAMLLGEADALVTFPGAAVDVGGFASVKAGRPSLLLSLGPAWSFW